MNLTEALDGAPTRDDLVVVGGDRLSTSELEATTSSVAAALAERAVGRGDRVAFQLPVGVEGLPMMRHRLMLGLLSLFQKLTEHLLLGQDQLRHRHGLYQCKVA